MTKPDRNLDELVEAMSETFENPRDDFNFLEQLIDQAHMVFVDGYANEGLKQRVYDLFEVLVDNLYLIITCPDDDYDKIKYELKAITHYLLKAPMPKKPDDLPSWELY